MDAATYLKSLGITIKSPRNENIGRLIIIGEFHLENSRGVIVSPKRGGVSDRYMDLLAAEDVGFVIIDTKPSFLVYGRTKDGEALEPFRALPINKPDQYPISDIFQLVADLLGRRDGNKRATLDLGSKLLAAKIADEKTDQGLFGPELVKPTLRFSLPEDLRDKAKTAGKTSIGDLETLQTCAAILAAFRISPHNIHETAILLDGLALFAGRFSHNLGLPAFFTFAFDGLWSHGTEALVVSQSVGSQLILLANAKKGTALLASPWLQADELLKNLFPSATFLDLNFLEWKPKNPPDRVVVIPPFGSTISSPAILKGSDLAKRNGKRLNRITAEILYIEQAIRVSAPGAIISIIAPEGLLSSVGHSDFREWILQHARLLAVVSLPRASCFEGTGIRCSLLYLKKTDPLPPDYPIMMMEAQEEDLRSEDGRKDLQREISGLLEKEAGR